MKFLSLFAGIGGIDLGLERAGMTCVGQVEIEPYCRQVLEKHWPNVTRFNDVRAFKKELLNEQPDIICGGFPCQDISTGSSTKSGLKGERSGLWFEFLRIIREVRPRFVLVENSAALLYRGLGTILGNLADCGFDAEWRVLQAKEFGAPHLRQRLFILAYARQVGGQERLGYQQNRQTPILRGRPEKCDGVWVQAPDPSMRMDDGISDEFYADRVGGLENSVVPQIAEWIGRRIMEFGVAA